MAARKQLFHPDDIKKKIQASQLINRLQNHALSAVAEGKYEEGNQSGKSAMTESQVRAAFGLLDKVVPSLKAIDMNVGGGLTINMPAGSEKV